jgi:hypothetical protein
MENPHSEYKVAKKGTLVEVVISDVDGGNL